MANALLVLGIRSTRRFKRTALCFRDVAVIGFVYLHNLAFAAHGRKIEAATAHRFHDAMMQKPSSVVLATQFAMQLVRRKAFLARSAHMERSRPLRQLGVATLHN